MGTQMKFALAALVATTQAVVADASVASNAACTIGVDKECKTATDSCCIGYKDATPLVALDVAKSYCHAKVAADQTAVDPNVATTRFGVSCKGRTAGAASLAVTAAAAATALYAMC